MGILKHISKKLKLVIISLFSVLLNSCEKDAILSFNRQDFIGFNLKTNGYYYYFSDRLIDKINGKEYYYSKVFFNYKNGLHFAIRQAPYDPLTKLDLRLQLIDKEINSTINKSGNNFNYKLNWGVFNVSGSEIEVERWVTSSGAGAYPTEILKGEIKNDTTIHFHTRLAAEPLTANGKKKTFSIDETYHFRQFSPKPDSTNKFIK